MPRFTDEQVEAARNASFGYLESRGCFTVLFPSDAEIEVDAENDDEVNQVLHDAMRAALEAAADTAPAVDTTEFEREIEAYRKALYRYENYWRYAGEEGGDPEELACKVVDSRQRLIDMFREAAR